MTIICNDQLLNESDFQNKNKNKIRIEISNLDTIKLNNLIENTFYDLDQSSKVINLLFQLQSLIIERKYNVEKIKNLEFSINKIHKKLNNEKLLSDKLKDKINYYLEELYELEKIKNVETVKLKHNLSRLITKNKNMKKLNKKTMKYLFILIPWNIFSTIINFNFILEKISSYFNFR